MHYGVFNKLKKKKILNFWRTAKRACFAISLHPAHFPPPAPISLSLLATPHTRSIVHPSRASPSPSHPPSRRSLSPTVASLSLSLSPARYLQRPTRDPKRLVLRQPQTSCSPSTQGVPFSGDPRRPVLR